MALHWQAVILLILQFNSAIFINGLPTVSEKDGKVLEIYQPLVSSVLDYLNSNPDRQYIFYFRYFIGAQKKTDDVTFIELEVQAKCLPSTDCPNDAIFLCKGLVEHSQVSNRFETLPGIDCQFKSEIQNDKTDIPTSIYESSTSIPKEQTNTPFVQISEYCPGCTVELDPNVSGVETLIDTALHHLESENNKKRALVRVLNLQREIVSGVKFILLLEVVPTVCEVDVPVLTSCPIDSEASSEICKIEYIQKPWISNDKHIISNNCTVSQEFTSVATKKNRNDFDNEIDVNNEYLKSVEVPQTIPESPNYEKMAETGTLDEPELNADRYMDMVSQIIPTNPTNHFNYLKVEATKFDADNSQMAIEDIPSLPTSTDTLFNENNFETIKPINSNINDKTEINSDEIVSKSTEETYADEPDARKNDEEVANNEGNNIQVRKRRSKDDDSSSSSSSSSSSDDDDDKHDKRKRKKYQKKTSCKKDDDDDEDDDNGCNNKKNKKKCEDNDSNDSNDCPKKAEKKTNCDDNDSNDNNDCPTKKQNQRSKCKKNTKNNDEDDDDDDDCNGDRRKRQLNEHMTEEEELVNTLARFSAESLDDNKWKHEVLDIIKVKKLELEGAVYHMVVRFATMKCIAFNECYPYAEDKLCKLQLHVSKDHKMRLLKSRCHKIERDTDKNRSHLRLKRQIGGLTDAKNDPEVKKFAKSTLLKLDAESSHEHKYKIVEIISATKQVVSGFSYIIKYEITLSDCPKNDNKDADLCGVLDDSKKEICNASIWDQSWLPQGTKIDVSCGTKKLNYRERRSVSTQITNRIKRNPANSGSSEESSEEKTKPDAEGIVLIPKGAPKDATNDQIIKDLTKTTLLKLDSESPHDHKYKIVKINNATKQVVSGTSYKINCDIILSDCPKNDNKDAELCGVKENAATETCDISIWDQPWLPEGKQVEISCGDKKIEYRERRSINRQKRNTDASVSSEESDEVKSNPASIIPGAQVDATNDEIIKDLTEESLVKLDSESTHDHKYKIVKIINATKQTVSGASYKIKCEIILSDCLKNENKKSSLCGEKKDAEKEICDISILHQPWLPQGKQVDISCGEKQLSYQERRKRQVGIPGAPVDASNDATVKELTKTTLLKLDSESPHDHKYKIVKINNATKQVVSGISYKINCDIILSDCPKNDNKDSELCGVKENAIKETCDISIWDQPWLPEGKKVEISCGTKKLEYRERRSIRQKRDTDDSVSSEESHEVKPNRASNIASPETGSSHSLSTRQIGIPGAPVDATNDEIIKDLTEASLVKLDSASPHDHKYKIVKVINATKQVVAGASYKIKCEIILSDCLKNENKKSSLCGEKKDAEKEICDISILDQQWLPQGKQVEISCGEKQLSYKERRKRQVGVPGAPVDASNDATVKDLTKSTLLKLDSQSSHDHKYKIVKINNATKQVVSGILYKINCDIILSDCPKNDNKDPELCGVKENAVTETCDISIWDEPWLPEGKKVEISCGERKLSYRERRSIIPLQFDDYYPLFSSFMRKHKKVYRSNGEEQYRFSIFKENMKKADFLNKHEQGTAVYGASKFADLHEAEFRLLLGYRPELRDENAIPYGMAKIPEIDLPTEYDWRTKGVVTQVKNQGQCGSCWAFSVTGNVEGQYAIKHGKLLEFSEQELVDCDKMDEGCNGGLMDNAYRAIEQLGGLELEADYPYDAEDETCHFVANKTRVQLSGAVNISQNEDEMAKWLVKNGPISIAINANAMQLYMGGVSHPLKFLCSPNSLDHGVLIVGYGVHTYKLFHKSLPYWTIKNSWGPSWGEQGYYRVYRGDGTCGVNKMASSAILE